MPLPSLVSRRRLQLLVLMLAHLTVDMYGGFLMPLIPALRDRLDVRLSAMTALAGTCGILVNAIQPFAGMISPVFRRPLLMMLGPVLAICMALIGTTQSFWVVAVLVLAGHVGIGVFHPDGLMAAHSVSGAKEHLGVPVFLSGGFFGFSLGAIVSTHWVSGPGFGSFWMLGLPGLVIPMLYAATGLNARLTYESHEPSRGRPADGVAFGWLLLLGTLMASTVCVLYTFLNVTLEARFGRPAIAWGGTAIALTGLCGALGSYGWGYLSARVSLFGLIAAGQLLYVPLYLRIVAADSRTSLIAASIPAGLVMGGAFFPLVAMAARRARGLTPGLRAGLIVGGSWGGGSIVAIVCGFLTDHGVTATAVLRGMTVAILTTAAVAAALWLTHRRPASPDA